MKTNEVRKPSQKFMHLIRFFATIICIGVTVYAFFKFNLDEQITPQLVYAILLIQPFLFAATLVSGIRCSFLVSTPPAPVINCTKSIILSAGLNLWLPGRLSELVKPAFLREHLGIPFGQGLAALILEKFFDALIVGALTLAGLIFLNSNSIHKPLIFFSFTLLTIFMIRPMAGVFFQFLEKYSTPIFRVATDSLRHIKFTLTRRLSIIALSLTLISWVLHGFAIWLFFLFLEGRSLSIAESAAIMGAMIFAGAAPALPGGIGAIQAAVTVSLIAFGFSPSEAFVFSLGLHLAEVLIAAFCTPIILSLHQTGVSRLLIDAKTAITQKKE